MKDDLISRQEALALAHDICVPDRNGGFYRHRCIDPQEIRELPGRVEKHDVTGHDVWQVIAPILADNLLLANDKSAQDMYLTTYWALKMYDEIRRGKSSDK